MSAAAAGSIADGLRVKIGIFLGPVAQLAEQQTLNLRVVGSIPTRLTIFSLALSDGAK